MTVVYHLADRDAQHVPGVVLVGLIGGLVLLWAAIRGMFGRRKK